jgi:MoaA/NifB/PqqE/SkfB family radical SAM enzyme
MDFKSLQKILPRIYSFLPFYLAPRFAMPPVQAFFEVTYRCNLRCDMCHYLEIIEETESQKTYKNELSSEEVKKAISRLPRF